MSIQWSNVSGLSTPIANGFMLSVLNEVEKNILNLLDSSDIWKTLDITYSAPRVERLSTQYNEYRISLHCIHPCSREEVLFHPHPWPSAMRILFGQYEMAIGYSESQTEPPAIATIILSEGSSYEMAHPHGWHYVMPLNKPAYTLMISGPPWNRSTPKNAEPLNPLSDKRKLEMLGLFKEYYWLLSVFSD